MRCPKTVVVWFGICASAPLMSTTGTVVAQEAESAAAEEEVSEKIPQEKLESLVAPIALYSDDLLAQTLVASTYPLEIIQLQQWMAKHPETNLVFFVWSQLKMEVRKTMKRRNCQVAR